MSPRPYHLLLPCSPRGSPHHPLCHPTHYHIRAHPLAGIVPPEVASRGGSAGQHSVALQGWALGTKHPAEAGDSHPGGSGSEQPLTFPTPQPPSEDKINGILLGFRLRYRELLYDSLRGFTLHGIGNPGATWAELTRECLRPLEALGYVGHNGWWVGDGRAASCITCSAPAFCAGYTSEPSCALRSCHLCATESDCPQHAVLCWLSPVVLRPLCVCHTGVHKCACNTRVCVMFLLCVCLCAAILRPWGEWGHGCSRDSGDMREGGKAQGCSQQQLIPHGDPAAQIHSWDGGTEGLLSALTALRGDGLLMGVPWVGGSAGRRTNTACFHCSVPPSCLRRAQPQRGIPHPVRTGQ